MQRDRGTTSGDSNANFYLRTHAYPTLGLLRPGAWAVCAWLARAELRYNARYNGSCTRSDVVEQQGVATRPSEPCRAIARVFPRVQRVHYLVCPRIRNR